MEYNVLITLSVLFIVFAALLLTRIGADLVMLGGLAILMTLQIVTPQQAFQGFANEAVLTVGFLFVVASGLQETGAMAMLTRPVLDWPRSLPVAQARLLLPSAAMSTVMNNTPVVAVLLPIVRDWARKINIPVSRLLIPLSYATVLGGLCTLIGTSTNLIVSGLVANHPSLPRLHFFTPAWIGLPSLVVGLTYILVCTRWLLPVRSTGITLQDDPREYIVEMIVPEDSGLINQTIEQAGLRHLPGLYLVEIERGSQVLPAVGPEERLQANDRLVFAGVVSSVVDLQKIRGLIPASDQVFKLTSPRAQRCLIEAVVSSSCPLVGKTVRDGRFRTVYNAAIIAVARQGARLQNKIGDIVLSPGDTLLLEAHPWFVSQHKNSRDFFLVSEVDNSTPVRHERAFASLLILVGLVTVASFGWMRTSQAALAAALLMILSRCCSGTQARRSIDWRVLIIIAASIGIGEAMEVSGTARELAHLFLGFAGNRPWLALTITYGVTMVCTELMTNNAAVVLLFPIALGVANNLGVNAMPFVISVMIAGSCGFATPIGYQTHLMVYGSGGYRFYDYLIFGIPLNLLIWAITVSLAPLIWPF